MAVIIDFLEAVWGPDVLRMARYGEIRVLGGLHGSESKFYERAVVEDMMNMTTGIAVEDRLRRDVYFGVMPRTATRGTAENVPNHGFTLWADVDGKSHGGKHEALMALMEAHLRPSIVVDSGNGYHAYWLLQQALKWDWMQKTMAGLARELRGDRVYDKARILRVPGTHNHKRSEEPIPVRLMRFDPDRKYRASAFADYRDEGEAILHPPTKPAPTYLEPHEGSAWEPSIQGAPIIAEGGRNAGLARLAGIMILRGLTPAEVVANLSHENQMRCNPPLPESEVLQIAHSVERYR